MDQKASKFCIRVRLDGVLKCIELEWDNVNAETFTQELFATFKANVLQEFDPVLILTDNLNMPVTREQFANIVKTFHAGSMFYLNAEIQPTNIKGACLMVTPMMLENYLVTKNKGSLLTFRTFKTIDTNTFTLISNELADFAVDAYGFEGVTSTRKKMIARAAISLFEAMKFKDSFGDGTEKILSAGSKFDNRLKYLQRRARCHKNGNLAQENIETENTELISTPEEDLLFLKQSVIDRVPLDIIKQKLNTTRALRKDKMKDLKFDIRESLPFFISHSHLILLDFDLANVDINPVVLTSNWPRFSQGLRDLSVSEKKYEVSSVWAPEVEDLLRLLKVFPTKGRNCEKLFAKSVEKLIVFRIMGSSPETMFAEGNNHPYVVASGLTPKDISCYFIAIERHLIPVPNNFGVGEVLDFFFKLHNVFHVNFDPNLVNMMIFLQNLVYKLVDKGKKSNKSTEHMLQICDLLKGTVI